MRIAFIATEFVTEEVFDGGLSNYLLRVALSLKNFGHEPVVFVATDRDEVIEHRGITVYRVKASLRDTTRILKISIAKKFYRTFWYLYGSYRINQRLKQVHRALPFDIAQYTHLMGMALFRSPNIPSIVRLSSHTQAWKDADELSGLRQQHVWEGLALKRVDDIFVPSQLVCSLMQRQLNRSIRIIESPFFFENETMDLSVYNQNLRGKCYLLFFGTISLLKGVRTIANMLRPLLENHPEIYFVFCGKDRGTPGGNSMVDELIEKAGEYHDRVLYLGRLNHEVLYPIIQNAVAVVLPSRIDNFPNTCIEAMAHKRVVVGTRGTSMDQLIDEGISGFLSEVDNELSLLEAVEKAIDLSSDERERMGDLAFERIQKLRPEIVVNQLLNYYREVIEKRQKGNRRGMFSPQ